VRILYFHQHFSTKDGATSDRSYAMARALLRRGHQVVMVCGSYRGADTGLRGPTEFGVRRGMVDGIDVVEVALDYSNHDGFLRRSATFLRFAVRGAWIALTEPCDLIFASSTPLTAGIPGIIGKALRGRPFVFEVRDLWPELPRAMGAIRNPAILAAMSALEWCCYRLADRCIGLAPGIVDGIARRGVPRDRIHLVPNASDLELFGGVPAGRRSGGAACHAVFAGTHGIANGLDSVLDAAAELKGRGNDQVTIELVGDGKMKAQLLARANRDGLTAIRFSSPMPKPALAKKLADADVGLMILADVPAFYNGTSPNKFFDYLASGLPVICNYPGWVAELVSSHGCGIAVPPGNPGALADALETMASDPERRASMALQSKRLGERFDRKHITTQLAEVIEATA